LELGDSYSNSNNVDTLSTKTGTKRLSDGNDSVALSGIEIGEQSITKPTKMVRVKIEPTDKK